MDDIPYGGGPGMVMKPEPLVEAIEAIAGQRSTGRKGRVILLSPQGARLDQEKVAEFAREKHLVLVCGRYEGVDQRVIDLAVDEEISIGDFVLSGGEIPAMVVIEAVTPPGARGAGKSALGGDGIVSGWKTRGTPVHSTGRVSRARGAGGAALR